MKTVLITGMAGFAGSHAMQHFLLNTDWNIIGIDSLAHKGNIARIDEVIDNRDDYTERVTFLKHDLARIGAFYDVMADLINAPKVDYIINFAAESHVDRSITDPVPFVRNNVELMLTMLELARAIKPEIFIQISTDEVYGAAPLGINHREWSTTLPSNPYSGSKAAQESLAMSYWRTYDVPVVITNCMNMFGERQDTEKYIPSLIKNIYQGNKVQVHGTETAIGSRFYLHARNHADALLYIIENLKPNPYVDDDGIVKPSRYNIVGDLEVNNLELALLVGRMLNKPVDFDFVDFHKTRPGHDRRYALDGNKLKNLGWVAPLDFEKSLQKTVDWSLEHGEWLA